MSPDEFWTHLDEDASQDPAIEIHVRGLPVKRVKLESECTKIGRMAENHIVLDDVQVSRSHARILKTNRGWTIEDQQSENGVIVNGQKVEQAYISLGDHIQIGEHRLIVVDNKEAQTINVEENMSHSDAPFREEHTVIMTDPLAHEALLKKLKAEKTKKKFPDMSFKLNLLGKVIEKHIIFEKGKKLAEPSKDRCVEIQVKYGQWVMYQKVNLDE